MNEDNNFDSVVANLKQQVDSLDTLFSSLKEEHVLSNSILKQVYSAEYQELKQRIQTLTEVALDISPELLSQLISLSDKTDEIYNKHVASLSDTENSHSIPNVLTSHNNNNNNKNKNKNNDNKYDKDKDNKNKNNNNNETVKKTKNRTSDKAEGTTTRKDMKNDKISNHEKTNTSDEHERKKDNRMSESTEEDIDDDEGEEPEDDDDEDEEDNNSNEPFTCPICEESKPRREGYAFKPCKHLYCVECLQAYFNTKINERKVLEIRCPHPNCSTQVNYYDVQRVVPLEMFSKYEDFTLLAALSQDPNCRWCPRPGCGTPVIGDPQYRRIVCPKCQFEFCFECQDSWHTGTCEQYRQWKLENGQADRKFDAWQKENTKPCPNCKTPIQKNEGCNHMTCLNCRYEFCWLCGAKYTPRHFDVYNVFGCPGLQGAKAEKMGLGKRIGVRLAIGTGLVLGGAICLALAVPAIIIGGPIYGGIKLHRYRKRRQFQSRRN